MTTVFKIGGSVIEDSAMMESFCREFSSFPGRKILVHGGGVMASELQESLGQHPVKINGRRVTDAQTLKAVTMTYAGWCSKILVACLQKYSCNAIGLSGCDADIIRSNRRPPLLMDDGVSEIDFGFVGDVRKEGINTVRLAAFLDMGLVPVINAINHDGRGQLFNTNADTVASSIASAMKADLVCCFELDGVLRDIKDSTSIIPCLSESDFERMKSDGSVADGMIPKIENCIKALRQGALSATIRNAMSINGRTGTTICL